MTVFAECVLQVATCNGTAVPLDERVQPSVVDAARSEAFHAVGEFGNGVPEVFDGTPGLGDGPRQSKQLLLQFLVAKDAVDDGQASGLGGGHQLNDSFETFVAAEHPAAPVPGRYAPHVPLAVRWLHHTAVELGQFTTHCGRAQL